MGAARLFILALLGSGLTLTQAPFHYVAIFPFVIIGLIHLSYLSTTPFLSGFVFGFGYFSTLLYWVGNSFTHVGIPRLYGILSVVALSSYMAAWIGFTTWTSKKLSKTFSEHAMLITTSWCLCEWLRSYFVLGGFPWGTIGYMWKSEQILQLCSVVGVYGLSFISFFLVSSAIVYNWTFSLAAIITLFLVGQLRLSNNKPDFSEYNLRLVQPCVYKKWDKEEQKRGLETLASLSLTPTNVQLNAILWPEAAFSDRETSLQGIISKLSPKLGTIISGVVRREGKESGTQVFNSIFRVNLDGKLDLLYDKIHLVPFGEYIPFSWLPFNKLTHGTIDFSSGREPRAVRVDTVPPFCPLICYEAVFGREIITKKRPSWLLNLTNDAWFSNSSGPYQHSHMARLRSVELGLPMVRVANNGISFVCDPCGRILEKLGYDKVGVIDFKLPKPLKSTFYSKLGDLLFFLMLLIPIGIVKRGRRSKRLHFGAA